MNGYLFESYNKILDGLKLHVRIHLFPSHCFGFDELMIHFLGVKAYMQSSYQHTSTVCVCVCFLSLQKNSAVRVGRGELDMDQASHFFLTLRDDDFGKKGLDQSSPRSKLLE